ncbi:DNA-binding response regulator [Pseudoalteromonas luteoviolacea B = ATCC 29581]|nr:DNA-binding response regulator [Pseudoalteromonas luteoviolacea B = ATCC 29581]
MSKTKPKILIIDDDLDYCGVIAETLIDQYQCYFAHDGHSALDQFDAIKPDMVMLDLGLPDMSGFTLAEQIAENAGNHKYSLFVISGDSALDTKLKAFASGADDFIAKPFEIKELISRVAKDLRLLEERKALHIANQEAFQLVDVTMKQASQYSYVMNFFKQLNACDNQQQVVTAFFDAMRFFGLRASIGLRYPTWTLFDFTGGPVSPIEANVFETIVNKGRLIEFGPRMMVNGKKVSFLIKNMPSDDQIKGEVRDYAAALIEGVDAKLEDLALKGGMTLAISDLKQTVHDINDAMTEHNKIVNSVLSDMLQEISASYHSLELTEPQEEFFTHLVEKGVTQLSHSEGALYNTQVDLQRLIQQLEALKLV